MELEEVQESLGGWRRWNVLMYCLISSATMFIASWHMLAIVYIGYIPVHHCNVSDVSLIPPDFSTDDADSLESCSMYLDLLSNATKPCDSGWIYSERKQGQLVPYNGSTIVTQWDLVCSKSYLKDLTQTILACGVMVGAMLFSILSDNWGRKPVFLFSQWAIVVVGVINALVNNFYVFSVLRFITGALQQGIILTGFVLACELFAARYRTFAGIMIEDFWAVASCLMPLLAYLIVDWSYLQLFISLSGLLTIPMYWLVPESTSWLYANGRRDEAKQIILKAAKFNGTPIPDCFTDASSDKKGKEKRDECSEESGNIKKFEIGCRWLKKMKHFNKGKTSSKDSALPKYTLLDVLRNRRLRLYVVIMSILWMVNSMVYFGLSLSTAALSGSRYLNAFFSALVEIPAYTSSFFVLQKWGRRYPLIAYHCLAGVALIVSNVLPDKTGDGSDLQWLEITVQMIGKFGITGAFGIVFLYAPEIFPTTLRSQALGISSMVGRLGYILTTFTPYLIEYVPWLPAPLFGSLSILAGLLALFLPETHNKPLPQTIEDIEDWFKKPKQSTVENKGSNLDNDKFQIEKF